MAFSWTYASALGKSISPMTFGRAVTSTITKLSLVTERRLMVSAGEGSCGPWEIFSPKWRKTAFASRAARTGGGASAKFFWGGEGECYAAAFNMFVGMLW